VFLFLGMGYWDLGIWGGDLNCIGEERIMDWIGRHMMGAFDGLNGLHDRKAGIDGYDGMMG
jgi:hypothetical protein